MTRHCSHAMSFLLDTNIVSELRRPRCPCRGRSLSGSTPKSARSLVLSIVTAGEIRTGRRTAPGAAMPGRQSLLDRWLNGLTQFYEDRLLYVDGAVADEVGPAAGASVGACYGRVHCCHCSCPRPDAGDQKRARLRQSRCDVVESTRTVRSPMTAACGAGCNRRRRPVRCREAGPARANCRRRHPRGLHQDRAHDPDAGRREALHDRLRAEGPATKYPFLLHRTPYGSRRTGPSYRRRRAVRGVRRRRSSSSSTRTCAGSSSPRASSSYAARTCRSQRGHARPTRAPTRYDTIDWLVKNVPNNNGRVGQWGISYPGWQTVWGMIDAHPALKASSPQAPAIDCSSATTSTTTARSG